MAELTGDTLQTTLEVIWRWKPSWYHQGTSYYEGKFFQSTGTTLINRCFTGLQDVVSDENRAISTFSAMLECAFDINCSCSGASTQVWVLWSWRLSEKPVYYGQVYRTAKQLLSPYRMDIRDALAPKKGPHYDFPTNTGSLLQLWCIYSLRLCEDSLMLQCSISC